MDTNDDKPDGCPGKFTEFSEICVECVLTNPRIICPNRSEDEIDQMFQQFREEE